MFSLKPFSHHFHIPLLHSPTSLTSLSSSSSSPSIILHQAKTRSGDVKGRGLVVVVSAGEQNKEGQRRGFLSLEEAGLVEISGLSTHERFLCRLTISSLNLLRVISEQEGVAIEELNAGRICDWFLKDKLKREQDLESAVLQWHDSDFQI